MPQYTFKFWAEMGWATFVAIAVTLMTALVTFEPSQITDWHVWATGLAAALVRAGAGAILAYFTKGFVVN